MAEIKESVFLAISVLIIASTLNIVISFSDFLSGNTPGDSDRRFRDTVDEIERFCDDERIDQDTRILPVPRDGNITIEDAQATGYARNEDGSYEQLGPLEIDCDRVEVELSDSTLESTRERTMSKIGGSSSSEIRIE